MGANLLRTFKLDAEQIEGYPIYDNKDNIFEAAIFDYCRISVAFTTPNDIVAAVKAITSEFDVVGLKNGYSAEFEAPPSGHRQVQIIVRFRTPETIECRHFTSSPRHSTDKEFALRKGGIFLAEVQLLHKAWLAHKLASSMTYKIRR